MGCRSSGVAPLGADRGAVLPGCPLRLPRPWPRHLYAHTINLELPRLLWASLGHTFLGYGLAVAVAVPLGFSDGAKRTGFRDVRPIVNALYSIPTVAFVPFLVIWFGLFFPARTALVFIMCVFDILVTIAAGARNVERSLIDVGRAFGAGRWDQFRKVLLPASLPFLFTALRIGLVRAVIAMITPRCSSRRSIWGSTCRRRRTSSTAAGLLAVLTILAVVGLLAQEGLKALEARLLPWHVRH